MKRFFMMAFAILSMLGAQAENSITIPDVTIAPGKTGDAPVTITSEFDLAGFQFFFALPEGVTVSKNVASARNKDEDGESIFSIAHNFDTRDNLWKYSALSLAGATIGKEGEVFKIRLAADAACKEGTYEVKFIEPLIFDDKPNTYKVGEVKFNITVGDPSAIHGVAADAAAKTDAVNLAGQKVGSNFKGILIQNGKKVIK